MRLRKVWTAVTLCLLMFGVSAVPSWADQLEDAVQQKQDAVNQQGQAKIKLDQLIYEEEAIKAQMAELEAKVAAAQILSEQRHAAVLQIQGQVAAAQEELALKQQDLEDRQIAWGKRAKAIYEEGQLSYFELLFQAVSLEDFVTRLDYFAALVDNDSQLLQDIQREKEQVTRKTRELEEKQGQAVQLEAQADAAKKDLDQAKTDQLVVLDKNKKEQEAMFEYIVRLESEANIWNEKIRQLQGTRSGSASVNGSVSTWPLPGYNRITSPYGWRMHPTRHQQSLHTGTDISAPTGAQIVAAGDGVVIVAGWNDAYGNMVIIDHGKGISTLYGHQSALNVTEGQSVQGGQVIGYVGSTGWSTGPHLHFEVRENGDSTDPLRYVSG